MTIRQWLVIGVAVLCVTVVALVVTFRPRPTKVKYGKVDPTRPLFTLELPATQAVKDRAAAFVLPEELVVPARAVIHVKGFVQAHSTTDGLIIAEILTLRPGGSLVMAGNGVTGVKLVANTDCLYELQLHYPKGMVGPAVVEVKLGDEYLAIAQVRMSP